jgi:hypothetical protein
VTREIAAAVAAILLGTSVLHAEEPKAVPTPAVPAALLATLPPLVAAPPQTKTPLRDALARSFVRQARAARPTQGPPRRPSRGVGRGMARGVAGALIGAYLGMAAGGSIGWALTKGSGGDSPGMQGALIGMPIGGIIGGVFGYQLLK